MKTEQISVEYVDHMGSDLNIVNAARVSFAKSVGEMREQDERLMKYLAEHGHIIPFAHASISVRCAAPLFLARQLAKSTVGAVWSEVSRRYIDSEPAFYLPSELHERPEGSIKQGCGEADPMLQGNLSAIAEHSEACLALYDSLLEKGVAPEEARMVLPLNTMTHWVWTGSLLFFARVYNLRSDGHAQLAAQEFAERLSEVIGPMFPVAWQVLTKKGSANEKT